MPPLTTPALADPGFELPTQTKGGYVYAPNNAPWTFAGQAGVSANGSPFTTPLSAPEGSQVAFLQGSGSISQVVPGFAAGDYQITVLAAQRPANNSVRQDFAILIDGAPAGNVTPAGGTYALYKSSVVGLIAGPHTLTFQGLNSAGGDNTAFLDSVQLVALGLPVTPVVPTPTPPVTPTSVPGPPGTPGSKWWVGSGPPANSLGADSDCYLDKLTGNVYQRAGGAYGMQTSIIGPSGSPGGQGLPGAPGQSISGPPGKGIKVTVAATSPANPSEGDVWILP